MMFITGDQLSNVSFQICIVIKVSLEVQIQVVWYALKWALLIRELFLGTFENAAYLRVRLFNFRRKSR
jgi:hypothetical protein